MRRKIVSVVTMAALLVGLSIVAAPSISYAVTITSISVTNGTVTFCSTSILCPNQIWNLGIGGIPLNAGQTLVLTQNQINTTGVAAYNFDTSDQGTAPYTVTVNGGAALSDTFGVLNFGGNDDPNSTSINQAHDWSASIGGVAGSYQVQVGYADTLHTNPICHDADANCLPENPWQGTATQFLGNGAGAPTAVYPAGPHCTFASANCYDAGAILITALQGGKTPEPSSLLLLGIGLLGLGAYGRNHMKKKNP